MVCSTAELTLQAPLGKIDVCVGAIDVSLHLIPGCLRLDGIAELDVEMVGPTTYRFNIALHDSSVTVDLRHDSVVNVISNVEGIHASEVERGTLSITQQGD
jgi:hypothetical protein